MRTYAVCLVLGTLILNACAQTREADLRSLLHDTDVNTNAHPVGGGGDDDDFEVDVYPRKDSDTADPSSPDTAPPPKPVKRSWGVPDTVAKVGRLFLHPIPDNAFEGYVKEIQFPDLPSWLSYSPRRGVLEGVPVTSDVEVRVVTVLAVGEEEGVFARDKFAIQFENIPECALLKEAKCSPKQDLTLLSILLAKSSELSPSQKVHIIHAVSKLFIIKANKISLVNSTYDIDARDDDSAIRSNPQQLRVQWSVGCDGDINKGERNVVKNVESTSKSGKLEAAIGVPVEGWIVNQVHPGTKRVRRDADYSGDYNDDDYDYNYEEYFESNINGFGKSPDTDKNTDTELDREVPTPATPVYPDFPSTPTPTGPLDSPVFKAVPMSTPVYIPVKPTRVVHSSPTPTYRTEVPPAVRPGEIESSLLTHPTTSADYTSPLVRATSSVRVHPSHQPVPLTPSSIPDRDTATDYAVKNFPPRVRNRIKKLSCVAGSVYRMKIPSDTFFDLEDGPTPNLGLVLKDEWGQMFQKDSWIQFDPQTQEIVALPMESNIGKYDFRLEAIDKGKKSVMDTVEFTVWQHKQARIFHHTFTAVMVLDKKFSFDVPVLNWQVKAVEKVAALFNDEVDNINVRNVTASNPVTITWTNTSLVDSKSTVCPTHELEAITEVLLSGHGSEPTRHAKRVFQPEFQLKKVHARFYSPCETHFHHGKHGGGDPGHPFTPEGRSSDDDKNTKPIIRNQIDELRAIAGVLFRYQVPDNTCYDMEDGDSRKLKLSMQTLDLVPPPKGDWLQFDAANQEFFGVPLQTDVGRKEILLVCMDRHGLSTSDALLVQVSADPTLSAPTPVYFSMRIGTPYDAFMSNAFDKVRLVERIARAFGDTDAKKLSIRTLERGSVKVEWVNNSLPLSPCPVEEVGRLRSIMTNDDGEVRREFKDFFLPDFRVEESEGIVPAGSCLAGDTPTYPETPDVAPPGAGEESVSPPDNGDEDYLLTFIIPAVIIAAMLLLAALIACCLYRRRRYGKMRMTDDNTFVSKGIPIIFAEELDDTHKDSAKSPVIMREEKPPLPPPEYQRGGDRPPSSEPNHRDDAPYHRPPPFTSNGAQRNPRPNLPPAYRKPPTYVPP